MFPRPLRVVKIALSLIEASATCNPYLQTTLDRSLFGMQQHNNHRVTQKITATATVLLLFELHAHVYMSVGARVTVQW